MIGSIDRRAVIAGAAAGTAALAACRHGASGGQPLTIGYVSPKTGPLAPFAAADDFVIGQVKAATSQGVQVGSRKVPLQILVRDSQSNPSRASEVAADLITRDAVDLMLVSSTPETVNPVSDQCEANGVPCVSTIVPWQPWFFTRGGKPDKGFEWTYHFFWGLEDVISVYADMWDQVSTNKVVGGLFPNDADGNAWGDPQKGFPAGLKPRGYSVVDPGRFQSLTDDFSTQIGRFKAADAQIITGVIIPPDLTTFWTQSRQQGLRPRAASIGKSMLFPSAIEALGDSGLNLSADVWWSPNHPFSSSLTGASSAQVAAAYTAQTHKQWVQPLGFIHALFEVAVDVARRSHGAGDRTAMRDALKSTKLNTIVGPVDWSKGPVPNVTKTPLVGGQWRRGSTFKYDIVIVSNKQYPTIPTAGHMELLS